MKHTIMKHAKKFAGILLALVMVLGMATTVFAAVGRTKLTINTTAGHTYKIYQLLRGDVSGLAEDGSGVLSNIEPGVNIVAGKTMEQLLAAIKGKEGAQLGDAAFEYAGGTPRTVVGDGTAKEYEWDYGYYLIEDTYTDATADHDTDPLSRYMVTVAGPTTVTPKISIPTIEKKIIDTDNNAPIDGEFAKTDTAAIGDTINFEVTGTVPNMEGYIYYYYVVNDTLSDGLDLVADSFVVTIGGDTLVKDRDYYVHVEGHTFKLAVEDLKKMVNDPDSPVQIQTGDAISIRYNATVNDSAKIGNDPNTNTVHLQYSSNPGSSERHDAPDEPGTPGDGAVVGEGPTQITKTYVTELTILKTDETGKKMTGAQFTLTGTNLNKVIVNTTTSFRKAGTGETGEYYKLIHQQEDGTAVETYTRTAPNDAAEGENGYNADKYENPDLPEYVRVTTAVASTEAGTDKKIIGTVNDQGYVTFTGLGEGTYTLTETVTPTGYSTMKPLEFTIDAATDDSSATEGGTVTWSSNKDEIVLNGAKGIFDSTVVNYPGTFMPSTGGIGTTIFYVAGSILLVVAVVLLIARRRVGANK